MENVKLTEPRKIKTLIFLFTITYLVSYVTRINFGAIISEMVVSTNMTRSMLSTAVTGSFVTYGAGQVISGFLGDKIQPKKLVLIGLLLTTTMNLLIPICGNSIQMTAIWCVNGFAQSFMWPPLVRLMVKLLSGEDYKRACYIVSCGASVGTILVYLVSPLIITQYGWKMVFVFSAICAAVMSIFWQKYCVDVQAEKIEFSQENSQGKLFTPLFITILVAIVLMGILRDGVTTWMPSYISETYNMSNTLSILTGVIMPIFGILCNKLSLSFYKKMPNNPIFCAGILFAAGATASFGISTLSGTSAAISVLLTAILTGCMHGVNLMLISMLPPFFQKQGKISFVSGVLNSCTYIGSAISTYGIALISETKGWGTTVFIWFVIAVVGTAICVSCIPAWKKFCEE